MVEQILSLLICFFFLFFNLFFIALLCGVVPVTLVLNPPVTSRASGSKTEENP